MGVSSARRRAWREATRSVMIPLVRALLREGLRYPDLVQLFQDVVIDAAVAEGTISGAALGRLTGLPRTARRSKLRGNSVAPRLSYADGVRLVSRWLLQTRTGRGKSSLRLTGPGSLANLAAAAGVDPETAVSELRRLGLVSVRGGRVTLLHDAYVPGGVIEKLDILGRDGAEFLRTVIHNVDRPPERSMLQRKASYDNIGSGALEGIRVRLRDEAIRVLTGVNQTLARVDRDRNPAAPRGRRMRVSFGVYVHEEPFGGQQHQRQKGRRPRRQS